MSTRNARKNARRSPSRGGASRGHPAAKRRSTGLWVVGGIALALIALGLIFVSSRSGSTQGGSYRFDVGNPGPGVEAPPIDLASTAGGTFNLRSTRGTTTLLYFQEGLTCQPCWDQLVDIQKNLDRFRALGIDQVVSITTDPIGQIEQKVSDEGITEPVLSDPDLSVSTAYSANSYGMMGSSRDGHTFIVVGPDGMIRWRADYGGPPDYTMFVPVDALVADIQAGQGDGS